LSCTAGVHSTRLAGPSSPALPRKRLAACCRWSGDAAQVSSYERAASRVFYDGCAESSPTLVSFPNEVCYKLITLYTIGSPLLS
jgi:hypothetical protein